MAKREAEFIGNDDLDVYEVMQRDPDSDEISSVMLKADEFFDEMLGTERVGEGEIRVKRLNGSGNSAQTDCGTYPLDKFSYNDLVNHIREKSGSGDYRFYVYQILKTAGKKPKLTLIMNKLVPIDAGKELVVASSQSDVEKLLHQQSEMLRSFFEQSKNPQRALDFEKIVTNGAALMTVVSPLVIAYLQNRPKQVDPFQQLQQVLVMTGHIDKLSAKGGMDSDDQVDNGMAGVFTKFLSVAERVISKQQAGLPGQSQEKNVSIISSSDPVYAPYATFFELLLPLASAGHNAGDFARELVKEAKESEQKLITTLLSMDDPLSFVLSYNAQFIKYAGWIAEVIVELDDLVFAKADLTSEDDSDTKA